MMSVKLFFLKKERCKRRFNMERKKLLVILRMKTKFSSFKEGIQLMKRSNSEKTKSQLKKEFR